MAGRIHYSFKAPALVGQALAPFQNSIPATAGMVDIDFPVRFTERPVFTYGYEHGDNAEAGSLTPMVASVVSWRTGRRVETGLPFYEGARLLITAPAAPAAGTGAAASETSILAVAQFSAGQSIPDNSDTPMEFSEIVRQRGSGLSWVIGAPSDITVVTAGIYGFSVRASLEEGASVLGIRQLFVRNSAFGAPADYDFRPCSGANEETTLLAVGTLSASAGDMLSGIVYQSSGGALDGAIGHSWEMSVWEL